MPVNMKIVDGVDQPSHINLLMRAAVACPRRSSERKDGSAVIARRFKRSSGQGYR